MDKKNELEIGNDTDSSITYFFGGVAVGNVRMKYFLLIQLDFKLRGESHNKLNKESTEVPVRFPCPNFWVNECRIGLQSSLNTVLTL